MAEQPRDLSSILAALGAAQRGPSTTPTQGQPPAHPGYPPPPGVQQPPPSYPPMPQGAAPPLHYPGASGYPMPQPSASGSVDLSSIRPVNSGTVSLADAIAQAKAFAAEKGVSSYDRPVVYANEPPRGPQDPRAYQQNSRSRSPPSRRDPYRDGGNPYRDERREDRGPSRDYGHGGGHGRERSYSPGPRGGGRTFSPKNGGGGGRERSPLRSNGGDDHAETIQIESSLVGLIIGRQGENLRRIEGESGCRGPRPRRAEVKTAINRIIEDSGMSVINRGGALKSQGDPRAGGMGGPAPKEGEDCLQIMVPDRTVGLIIGRGGETIRDLQERSGCHINITSEAKEHQRPFAPSTSLGSPQGRCHGPKEAILEIVDKRQPWVTASRSRPRGALDRTMLEMVLVAAAGGGGHDKINDTIHVPSEAVGMIIGKGGETIREMQNNTGCKINVAQSSGPGEVEREIALIGSRESITQAKAAIEEKVDAVRQKSGGGGGGRDGGGRGRQQQHHDYDSYSQQASNAPAQANAPAAPAPAAADGSDPYAQYGGYQNYLALWYQSLMYQQQQGGSAPPAGGPPAPGAA
ncbi:KH domain-containing protein [Verticillium alfalfae VaMs.102]|uniref:KH domain-containing protein n=1 Tax=Verticillium alfalfae (strain VaMs.102 / ATCC MYA-4576 / FGSC 10136) TaxID=526221 RepID=C9SFC5_VERA1|nr:KH domain-containing protein [Verticillium alfalfae VaMs.102]EEY17911.1 KH domain-containing protein [Verticillium alfalfae VaMs.102]